MKFAALACLKIAYILLIDLRLVRASYKVYFSIVNYNKAISIGCLNILVNIIYYSLTSFLLARRPTRSKFDNSAIYQANTDPRKHLLILARTNIAPLIEAKSLIRATNKYTKRDYITLHIVITLPFP